MATYDIIHDYYSREIQIIESEESEISFLWELEILIALCTYFFYFANFWLIRVENQMYSKECKKHQNCSTKKVRFVTKMQCQLCQFSPEIIKVFAEGILVVYYFQG